MQGYARLRGMALGCRQQACHHPLPSGVAADHTLVNKVRDFHTVISNAQTTMPRHAADNDSQCPGNRKDIEVC